MSTTPQPDGPLERPPGPRGLALAQRWRRFRAGVPSALYLFGWAVLILLVGTLLGWLLAKVASHDAFGRADARADRVLAADRTARWNTITHDITDLSETPTITIMAVVTVIGAALAWRRWREPMLVAVAVPMAVALARVYRGMHYPTDVLGGAALGASWLAVTIQGIRLGVFHDQLRTGAGRLGRLGSRSRVHSQKGSRS